jgi:hypothetical protein
MRQPAAVLCPGDRSGIWQLNRCGCKKGDGMPEDPRGRNQQFDLASIEGYVRGYAEVLSKALLSVDWQQLNHVMTEIEAARIRGARLWVAGNGGSAAIADHLLCDWVKGTYTPEQPPIYVHSLVANTPLLTAIANDFSYEVGFSRQLEMQAKSGCVGLHIILWQQPKHTGGIASGQCLQDDDYCIHRVQWR